MTSTQRTVLRLGAVLLLVAALVVPAVAILLGGARTGDGATGLRPASGTTIELPAPGLFGGSVPVYGRADDSGPPDLRCRLLTASGEQLPGVRLSQPLVRGDGVVVDGTRLDLLFEVEKYPPGARLECPELERAAPVVVGAGSTWGSSSRIVVVAGIAVGVLCGALGLAALILLRFAGRKRP